MKRYGNSIIRFFFGTIGTVCAAGAWSQTQDDNVVITDCQDRYVFAVGAQGSVSVKNTKTIHYTAMRNAETIQPAAYYGDGITMDRAASAGRRAQYRTMPPHDVFFDDSKVCFFNIPLSKIGAKAQVTFERTFTDTHQLARVFLSEDFFVKNKSVSFVIPASCARYRIQLRNAEKALRWAKDFMVECQRTVNSRGDSVITFCAANLPAPKDQPCMPAPRQTEPYMLVTGDFDSHLALYRWWHSLASRPDSFAAKPALLQEILAHSRTRNDSIGDTFAWVQRNIRYVAVEAGISGHQPDKPSEVVRKRYGDCKGMACLLTTLLRAQGFNAQMAIVGTREVDLKPSKTPSLAAANHMICVLYEPEATYFLDATSSHIPFDYIPYHIQGREAMVEQGDTFRLEQIPLLPTTANTDSLCYRCQIVKQADNLAPLLAAEATAAWQGDAKELALSALEGTPLSKRQHLSASLLNADNHQNRVDSTAWSGDDSRTTTAVLRGKVMLPQAVQQVGRELYIDMDLHNEVLAAPIDTAKRTADYVLPFGIHAVRRMELEIPQGIGLGHLPHDVVIDTQQGTLACRYRAEHDPLSGRLQRIVVQRSMDIVQPIVAKENICAWNEALRRWKATEAVMLNIEE